MIYIVAFFVVLLDQWTKLLVINKMELFETIPLIKGVFHLTYIPNTGAAFGMFQDGNLIFIVLSMAIITAILIYTYRAKIKGKLTLITLGMIIGGAFGNLIDRFVHKAVIDFLDVRLINFAIFNVADCFVVVGCILFAIILIFFDKSKENELKEHGNEGI